MKLQSMDLNLLVGFEALLIERSVSGAGRRMGLSQPAMSNVLARLRMAFGDPLFRREGQRMVPTPRARQLADAIVDALNSIRKAVGERGSFDAFKTDVQYTIAATDCAEAVVLPGLLETIKRRAPNIAVRIKRLHMAFSVPARELDSCDFALGLFPLPLPPGAGLLQTVLFKEKLVGIIKKGHPAARGKFGLRQFLAQEHIGTSYNEEDPGLVGDAVRKIGHRRRVGLVVPHFVTVPFVAARTEMLGFVPSRLAQMLSPSLGLRTVELPVQLPPLAVSLVWHERHQHDPAHHWFREFAVQCTERSSKQFTDSCAE
jgi:DNA-binding transcriptional LysR family regulator